MNERTEKNNDLWWKHILLHNESIVCIGKKSVWYILNITSFIFVLTELELILVIRHGPILIKIPFIFSR